MWFCALALVACGTAAPTGGGNEADVAADVAADVGVADAAQDGEIAQASDTLAKDVLTLDVDAAGTDASGDAAAEVTCSAGFQPALIKHAGWKPALHIPTYR